MADPLNCPVVRSELRPEGDFSRLYCTRRFTCHECLEEQETPELRPYADSVIPEGWVRVRHAKETGTVKFLCPNCGAVDPLRRKGGW